jgi:acetolactate synthase-1/2/3 large subunit
VLVDVTKDAQENAIPVDDISREFNLPGYQGNSLSGSIDENAVDQALELIKSSKRPLIYMGQGVILGDAHAELRAFAEKFEIPVATTVLGLGGFPASHELYQGTLGMHGAAYANFAIDQADVVITLGARFDDRVTGKVSEFIKHAKIIHVDVDASEFNKNKLADVAIKGDLKSVLKIFNGRAFKANSGDWRKHLQALKVKHPLVAGESANGQIKPQNFLKRLSQAVEGQRTIYTTGVGQHQMWAAQHLKFEEPRTFITSAGLGTMGFGLPASVGAKLGRPDSLVINIDGDGSFEMNINELRTIADRNIPVKQVILNNKILGMVGQWQRKFYGGNYSSVEFQDHPHYAEGIEALYGIKARRIDTQDQIDGAIQEMLKHDGPYVLDVRIPKEENVYPMIPGGKSVADMILDPSQRENV